MPKLRKGELKFYQSMNPAELNTYLNQYPQYTEYVKYFLERYEYNWVKGIWKRGRTI